MTTLLLSIIALSILSCASGPKRPSLKQTDAAVLTKEEAIFRAKRVSKVRYNLYFDLSEKAESYKGISTIQFDLKDNKADLRIDFHDGKIDSLTVNNHIQKANYNHHYLLINKNDLKVGDNKIEIAFTQKFSRHGSGFYRFVDEEDGRIYTYTDLEPYDANKVFPCFDQPNLKATYTMQVLAPKSWKVVTSTYENKTTKKGNHILWNFPTSAYFSTYIWSLHAGPYHVFTDKTAKYPSRLFVRQTLKKYVKVKDWFTFTRQSFEFMDEYFAYPYPYKKYDQLIVPDFNAGAMENVAAVTFQEGYVRRGIKPRSQRRRLANVIFHEMAHMWFGNLVTMNWWNDLWLNESFATYIANLGLSRNTEFKNEAWQSFNGTKRWAYWEDQLVTTHPIEAVVPDTTQAFANFDGITYGKGASSLKQIHYKLGDAGFKKGLQIYFQRHANTNTELKDFMGALEEGSGQKLGTWQKKWLQTTGVNTIAANFTCDMGKIKTFTVSQTAPKDSYHIRPHSFEVALVNRKGGNFVTTKTQKVNLNGETTQVPELVGANCPDVVYPNYEDHDYVMVQLDKKTLNTLESYIGKISDDFLRQLAWGSLWDMVYYGQYSYRKYADILRKSLPREKNFIILENLLATIYGRGSNSPSILFYAYYDQISPKQREKLYLQFENLIWKLLVRAKGGSELQKILYKGFVNTATTKSALDRLVSILAGKTKFAKFKIDQDKRWGLIITLNSFSYPGAKKLADAEAKKDKSSLGKKMYIAATAAMPEWSTKQNWIKEYLKAKSQYSYSQLRTALYSLFPRHQAELRKKYSDRFFDDMKYANSHKDSHVAATFAVIGPKFCSKDKQSELHDFIDDEDLLPGVLKKLRIIEQENTRCQQVLSKAQSGK